MIRRLAIGALTPAALLAATGIFCAAGVFCAGGCATSEMQAWAQTAPAMLPDQAAAAHSAATAHAMDDVVLLNARMQPE
jgi:hypothetical protein